MDAHQSPLDHETITALARKYWQADGEPVGHDWDYWLRAEAELRKQITAAATKTAAESPLPKTAKNARA